MVVKDGVRRVPFFGRLFKHADVVWIDRRKSAGNSELISRAIRDHSKYPLALAPEGKISNGDFLFRFRTGGFLTDEQMQGCTIRYTMYGAWGGVTLNSIRNNDLDWMWTALCVPLARVDVTFLEPFSGEKLRGKEPRERADMMQLAMCNSLGTLASERSSAEIFADKK
jgi:1-acyl-sn-glycerol-3-phosphate acyltransferase